MSEERNPRDRLIDALVAWDLQFPENYFEDLRGYLLHGCRGYVDMPDAELVEIAAESDVELTRDGLESGGLLRFTLQAHEPAEISNHRATGKEES